MLRIRKVEMKMVIVTMEEVIFIHYKKVQIVYCF
ncbi:hypothetical protein IGA_05713 [Bacillus cereus HuA3-9]|uniref:Uncharacterized protein n=1 Tax=Bacillus cereus HuA3-9 TaxID=1053205 RepID=R8CIW2_BACCE|nr:hypothetical protein IGA_05713 [Bacillus cereus HuA3-9]